MADSAKLPGGGQKGRPGRPGVAPTPPQPPTPPKMKPIPPASRHHSMCQASTSEEEITVKYSPIVITIGHRTYNIRIKPELVDRFYELMRTASLNKVTDRTPVLDGVDVEELWTMFTGADAHRMLIENLIEHLTSIAGDLITIP